MSASAVTEKTWVAFGPVGAIGTIHRSDEGYSVRMLDESTHRGVYENLDVAKSALFAAMLPGSDWPEFRER